jgi:undecaprenyl-diphosphatase
VKSSLKYWFISFFEAIDRKRLLICLVILFPLSWLIHRVFVKDFPPFDQDFLYWLHQSLKPLSDDFFKVTYGLTGIKFTAFIVASSLGFLIWKKLWNEAKVLAISTAGILIIIDRLLKPFLNRLRPDNRLVEVDGKSFPSGHAAGNVVLYFYLAYLLSEKYPKLTVYIYLAATFIVLLIGLSSIYLKVHWPSDILAGYGVGYIWLTICLALLKMSRNNDDD